MNLKFPTALLLLFLAGCATTPRTTIPRAQFPAEALITQRGVLTVLGRQFTLNGYLAQSATGKRLIVTENFGGVLADVLVKPDGAAYVMRSSPAFKPKWIHDYLAADVQCIFGNEPRQNCPGQMLDPKHFVIKRRWYQLDLRIVEVKPGQQSPEMFDETKAEKL
jgi:hypothetical protein